MASQARNTTSALERCKKLQSRPDRFGLYTALRAVECAHPDQPRIGQASHLVDEPFRIAQMPSMNFAASSISNVDQTKQGQIRIWQSVLGLFGPNGPLPLHLTETAWQRLHNHSDPTITGFLNLFHHRLLSLFYRARADAEPALHFDRPHQDRFQDYVGSLCGLGTEAFRDRDAMPDMAKLHFAGRLGSQAKNSEGLEEILATYLQLPIRIEQFAGQWIALPIDSRNAIGTRRSTSLLGRSATIGSHVWDCQQKFRIVVGPVNLDDYERLLPGGDSLKRLRAVVRNYLGHELQWEVQVRIQKDAVPRMQLGVQGSLGWRDWLSNEPMPAERGDLVLQDDEGQA